MSRMTIQLPEVDEVRVTIIVDNAIDPLMVGSEVAQRYPMSPRWLPKFSASPNPFEKETPIAEHGFSAFIQVSQGESRGAILFDTGLSSRVLLYNMDVLEIAASDIETIVLSHGHPDHALGLTGLVGRLGGSRMPLLLHPDALLERKVALPDGYEIGLPAPRISDLRQGNIEVVEEPGPSTLVHNMILVSGEVARTEDFEKGFPIHHSKRGGGWEPDPLIMDDQCAVANVRDKGLVIVTGCGHAGIINIIRNAQRMTGVETVYGVIGGFHLTGGLFESVIPITVAALHHIAPRYVVPCHCTGWSAVNQIANAMPEAYLASSVGTTFVL